MPLTSAIEPKSDAGSSKVPLLLRSFHRSTYSYGFPATESHNEVRLQPLTDGSQTCKSFRISTRPDARVFSFAEIGGNVHHFTVRNPHQVLEIETVATVETYSVDPFADLNLLEADLDFYAREEVRHAFAEFLAPSCLVPLSEEARQIANSVLEGSNGVAAQFLLNLNSFLFKHLAYDPDVTHVQSTVAEALELRAGVCQDFAHVMISCCRAIGIPARYVSGYLHISSGSSVRGWDAMHAWVECPLPQGRWLSLDPTNNLLANEHHIRVHTGRDYDDITPFKGLYMGTSRRSLNVEIRVDEISNGESATQNIA